MHYYIVDPQKLSQREFERVQNILYSSLSEFRISGEVMRMTGLRTIQQLVENAFAHEAKTIVAVGSDETLHEVINAIGKREMTTGFIPLVASEVARVLGIGDLVQAIKTIAFRRVESIDLGLVNNYYFLSKLNFDLNKQLFEIKFMANDKFLGQQSTTSGLIVNSRADAQTKGIGDPIDGLLDVLFLPQISTWNQWLHRRDLLAGFYEKIPQTSILHVKKIEITSPEALPLKIGSKIVAKTPATITVAPDILRMIVGKDRKF